MNEEDVIHVSGTPISIYDRIIQRCVICGHKLHDSKDEENLIPEDCFPQGMFVIEREGGWMEPSPILESKLEAELICLRFVE